MLTSSEKKRKRWGHFSLTYTAKAKEHHPGSEVLVLLQGSSRTTTIF
jgi:hypothetical protein